MYLFTLSIFTSLSHFKGRHHLAASCLKLIQIPLCYLQINVGGRSYLIICSVCLLFLVMKTKVAVVIIIMLNFVVLIDCYVFNVCFAFRELWFVLILMEVEWIVVRVVIRNLVMLVNGFVDHFWFGVNHWFAVSSAAMGRGVAGRGMSVVAEIMGVVIEVGKGVILKTSIIKVVRDTVRVWVVVGVFYLVVLVNCTMLYVYFGFI